MSILHLCQNCHEIYDFVKTKIWWWKPTEAHVFYFCPQKPWVCTYWQSRMDGVRAATQNTAPLIFTPYTAGNRTAKDEYDRKILVNSSQNNLHFQPILNDNISSTRCGRCSYVVQCVSSARLTESSCYHADLPMRTRMSLRTIGKFQT